jgi:hypothetical protein
MYAILLEYLGKIVLNFKQEVTVFIYLEPFLKGTVFLNLYDIKILRFIVK